MALPTKLSTNGGHVSPRSPIRKSESPPSGPITDAIASQDFHNVKIDNSNLTQLKNACDDAVQRFLSHPGLFKQVHHHTDVRLVLGWTSVFIAAGIELYGNQVKFEKAKPVMWIGLILYVILIAMQKLYVYFVVDEIVFVGNRVSGGIITGRLTISSRTEPANQSNPPKYQLSVTYTQQTSEGRSLPDPKIDAEEYNNLFDEEGVMDQVSFRDWMGKVVDRAMEGKSTKGSPLGVAVSG